jgi:peptidylprolyl isomerase domain and WD repeat-containing protein 1
MDPHSGFLAGPVLSHLVNFFSKASNLIFCPPCSFESKVETDLYEFAKKKTQPVNLCLSPRGDMFATMAEDRRIRVFRLLTGKLVTVIDESLQHYTELQQVPVLIMVT